MTHVEAWLVLSFAIMVVAALASLYEKVERLARRMDPSDGDRASDGDASADATARDARSRVERRV